MAKPFVQVAVHIANGPFEGEAQGEVRCEIDLDGEGAPREITWLYYVPIAAGTKHRVIRLPLVSARWGVSGVTPPTSPVIAVTNKSCRPRG